jgi:SnoaL-like domain
MSDANADLTRLADRYIAMWNETDGQRRRGLIAETWTETGRYRDPMLAGDGPDGIDAMVAAVQTQYPAHRFHRTGPVDAHNQALRFTWELREEGEPPFVVGLDVGEVAADGRLQSITGFFDQVVQPG